ncbi:hypothetical protein ACVIHI_003468 [Bradyrhizobium sp. USDA 4524]|uniref:DUF4238 domain-containing protein n=1 Tax=unclassified Bradyrhizobium TaxID=2631580 RepID=UPI00209F3984|nr:MULTISPECIES: DUF4238 domain-containing protein [unclassified Bradyrhizobium]MCP1843614.1 hypothetical protein [Bradyrhizobium sp. USDA 4538]MCP1904180.1 hypothetical protein [Bradyrhizobium sp. USDA 4537]MCP1990164.1 hypothetical protein [Bradyrhizobium sp. USDA 4539]
MPGQKHHYIPEFFLKQWTGSDGRLCEYARPYDKVKAQMKHPGGTGYVRGLYTLKGVPPELADAFENQFLSIADGTAAVALRVMLDERKIPPMREKMAWVRFILTLIHRTPEGVARNFEKLKAYYDGARPIELLKDYESLKQKNDPPTAEEWLEKNRERVTEISKLEVLANVMQSEKVGNRLLSMHWHLGRFENLKHTILTSDRPIVMTDGLKGDDSHIVMALSPQHMLCIAATDKVAQQVISMPPAEIIATWNDRMARQARKFVYGTNDRHLRFVENRLGEKIVWSPFE